MQRIQKHLAFERLLARLPTSSGWVLKGGFALELRYRWQSRPTKDIDLRTTHAPDEALDQLRQTVTSATIPDHFSFEFGDAARELQGAPGGTVRVSVLARVAGTEFARLSVDLSSGDALVGEPETLEGSDLMAYACIPPVRFPVYPVAQHLAEKLHAYTLPREDENTRTKDFVDLAVIAAVESAGGPALLASLQATFDARATHPIPHDLPTPPQSWAAPFRRLAGESPLASTTDLTEAYQLLAAFWDPVLAEAVRDHTWSPNIRSWVPTTEKPSPR